MIGWMDRAKRIEIPLWAILAFLAIFIYKLVFFIIHIPLFAERGYEPHRVVLTVLIEDMGMFALLILFYFFLKRLRYLLPLLVSLFLTFYLIDVEVFKSLYRRLTIINLIRFWDEPQAIFSFVSMGKILMLLSLLIILILIRGIRFTIYKYKTAMVLPLLALMALPWAEITSRGGPDLFFLYITGNLLRVNQQMTYKRGVNYETYEEVRRQLPHLFIATEGLLNGKTFLLSRRNSSTIRPPNLILLIAESLSQVDSLRSGGIYNRLPHIDRIISEGLTLKNVVSNGSSTSEALASLLLGVEQLPTALLEDDMMKRFPPEYLRGRNLILRAKQKGYKTIFLSNSLLEFQNTKKWLEALGFDYIEGAESGYFQGFPKYTFNCPEDRVLYSRALQMIKGENGPFFMVLLTVSLHPPWLLPDDTYRTSNDPLTNLLNYVDRTIYSFYQKLKESGFFENGTLIIVGDHRRMTELDPEEFRKRGVDAYGRVVCGIVGRGIRKGTIDNTPLNHNDLQGIVWTIMNGTPLPLELYKFNKAYQIGIKEPFTLHLLNDEFGMILVRLRGGTKLIRFSKNFDPLSQDQSISRDIGAYMVLSGYHLQKAQMPDEYSLLRYREEVSHRLNSLWTALKSYREIIGAGEEAYRPDEIFRDIDDLMNGLEAGNDWWHSMTVGLSKLWNTLPKPDRDLKPKKWRKRNLDRLFIVTGFEMLPRHLYLRLTRNILKLNEDISREKLLKLWSEIDIPLPYLERPHYLRPFYFDESPVEVTRPFIIAHRGGLSPYPENSLSAFKYALLMGADGLECDLRLSRDGRVFVLHDDNLSRLTGIDKPVSQMESSELLRLRLKDPLKPYIYSSESPLLLERLIEELADDTILWLELKPDGGEDLPYRVGELIQRYGLQDRVIVSSFSPEMLKPLRENFPGLLIAYEFPMLKYRNIRSLINADDRDRIIISADHPEQFTPTLLKRLISERIRTSSYTVNRYDELKRAIDSGITYIQTDRPDRARFLINDHPK